MTNCTKSNKSIATVTGIILLLGSAIIWKARKEKLNQEIDEFDRIMHELKIKSIEQYDYYREEACERKEVTRCCQIR